MELSGQLYPLAVSPLRKDSHWIGDWTGPRAGLDTVVNEKIPVPTGNRTLVVQPIA